MSEVETVWALSRGSYSDYRVLCIVRGGEDEAKLLAARANAAGDELYEDPYEAEELAVVDPDVQKVEILTLTSEIFDDGRTKESDPRIRVEWPFDALYGTPSLRWRWVRAPMYRDKGGRLEVWGTDHERVRRVFSDRRAMLMTDDAMRARTEAEGKR
jgi:hypothetical protein